MINTLIYNVFNQQNPIIHPLHIQTQKKRDSIVAVPLPKALALPTNQELATRSPRRM